MKIGAGIANTIMGVGRGIGRMFGYELAVDLSENDISLAMDKPGTEDRAWDDQLYKRGNVFVDGYANPIKPKVQYRKDLEEGDEITVQEGKTDDDQDEEEKHVELIASPRYRDYMRQDLISQLLTPQERWKLLAYAIILIGGLVVINLVVSLSAAGAF